jgi:hypothetical protein
MVEVETNKDGFISSIEFLNRTGLSRATLNNYIKIGILPHPLVKRPNDETRSKAKRLGYFPDSVLNIVNKIIQYKKMGCSMTEISKTLTQKLDNSLKDTQINDILTTGVRALSSDQVNKSEDLLSFKETRTESIPPEIQAQRTTDNLSTISTKEKAVHDIFQQRMPIPLSFSVLVADLQDSIRMCAELPPEEYFSLINQIWICAKSSFQKYFGIYGKHTTNGMVYYFLKDHHSNYLMNAILCALELKEKMKTLSAEWKKETGWYDDLYLNVGINEGYEFFGKIPAAPVVEFITLGDTAKYALILSDFACGGSIWTTKNLLIRLDKKVRNKICYGIRHSQPTHDVLVKNTFSRLADLIPHGSEKYVMFSNISAVTVTEIHNLYA